MTPSQIKTSLLVSTLCAALAACGGGDDDSATPTPTPAAPTFASCFEVTAGVAYTMADTDEGGEDAGHHRVLMVKEPFEGADRGGSVELADATDVRRAASYWSQESNGIRLWGSLDYDETGTALTKLVNSDGSVLPLSMQAGQSAALSYTITTTQLSGTAAGQTATAAAQETWTFEDFESLTLGGKEFTNVCRIKTIATQPGDDGASTLWFAKGFGLIRAQHTNSAGVIREETSLDTITAQP